MKFLSLSLIVFLSACMMLPSLDERLRFADSLAAQHDWHRENLPSGHFDLVSYLPERQAPAEVLTVYIEGDGLAWIAGSQPSNNPTPRDPLALRLALAQPEGTAAYLARPCQYVDAEASVCAGRYWTKSRFAPEVITATNRAIDTLKRRFHANHLILVGYSGGGAVAMLVAARRTDVDRLVTVAGNLDTRAWVAYHRIHPLDSSLNPADEIKAVQEIPQWHLVGGKDKVVPPLLVENFVRRFGAGSKPVVYTEPAFDHHCCWVEQWPSLWWKIRDSR